MSGDARCGVNNGRTLSGVEVKVCDFQESDVSAVAMSVHGAMILNRPSKWSQIIWQDQRQYEEVV